MSKGIPLVPLIAMHLLTKKTWYAILASAIYLGHLAAAPVTTYLVFKFFDLGSADWWILVLVFVITATAAIVSFAYSVVQWRTMAYTAVPEVEWRALRNAQFHAGLDDTKDYLGLIRRFSRPEDNEIAIAISDHLKDSLEVERIKLDYAHAEIKHFYVATSRIIPIAIFKLWLIAFGLSGVIILDDYKHKLISFLYVLVAVFVYPNYAHWRHMLQRGVGFEINNQCFGSIYPKRQIIYWKDVDRFYIIKRGWRKFLIVELYLGTSYQFDISLYALGGVNYFAELMKMYWDRNEGS